MELVVGVTFLPGDIIILCSNPPPRFCEEDIDQILERRTQVIQLESEGKGSTFAKVRALLTATLINTCTLRQFCITKYELYPNQSFNYFVRSCFIRMRMYIMFVPFPFRPRSRLMGPQT